ncbi:MAG: TetR/AcrR family transcriptional regulator [Chloroflexales bacterium]|jgi:TetR/AcrR family transcriptional regulator
MKNKPPRTGDERLSAEARRTTILDAAVTEFASFGFHGASTDRIATAVGISQPYIFRLFGTKKELFVATVERAIADMKATLRVAVAANSTDPLTAVCDTFIAMMYRRDQYILLLQGFATTIDPDMMAIGRTYLADMYAYVAEVTGRNETELQEFFAYGMLFIVAAALDLPAIAHERPWAANLIRRWR